MIKIQGMTYTSGKTLSFSEDPIGLNTKVFYRDQNGKTCRIDMQKFYDLAKKSKDKKYFGEWLHWLKNKELTIGAFIISGLDKLAREFPKEINKLIIENEK